MISIKLSEYRIEITSDKDPLAIDQNDQMKNLTKFVNVYIVYNLDAWPRNPTNNFNLRIAGLEQLI